MKGVLREGGSERRKMIADMAKNLGGELESSTTRSGDDVYSVVDLPDNVTARPSDAHLRGRQVRCNVTVLVTPEEMDRRADQDVLSPAGRLSGPGALDRQEAA